ncbi:hypothetical protein PR003_g30015 [Phytophthora rubi]|uniref:Uncharacterized protein n=1 Tax=Phytophthora rubi TaxID=129364 RepID=A0A6A4BF42_9STRA|nr:hypothetical protein PR003_g30015 [Phytophthora rubi]
MSASWFALLASGLNSHTAHGTVPPRERFATRGGKAGYSSSLWRSQRRRSVASQASVT